MELPREKERRKIFDLIPERKGMGESRTNESAAIMPAIGG
jgi:hypothetical protein